MNDGIMVMNRKKFLLTYSTPLMDEGPLHKDLRTLADTNTSENVLSRKYTLPVDVEEHD